MTEKIIYLRDYKAKKAQEEDLARGRTPLYVSHLNGKINGSVDKDKKPGDFGPRLARINSSLEEINRLMAELKKLSVENPNQRRRKDEKE